MMEHLEELQAHRAELRKLAYGSSSGVKRVTFGGRTVEYRDLSDIRQALRDVEREIALLTCETVGPVRRRITIVTPRSGL